MSWIVETNLKCILEELKQTLVAEENKDPNMVSLDTIATFYRKIWKENKNQIQYYRQVCDDLVKQEFNRYSSFHYRNFHYDTEELKIGFFDNIMTYGITLTKRNGDLRIIKSETTLYRDQLFALIHDPLSKLYDELLRQKPMNEERCRYVQTSSPSLLVDISINQITLFWQYDPGFFNKSFAIEFSNYLDRYHSKCNSGKTMDWVDGKERELFKKIYVNIQDCPEWSRKTLKELREQELEPKRLSFVSRLRLYKKKKSF